MLGLFLAFLGVGVLLWIISTLLYDILRYRPDMLPEAYPYQWLSEITTNYDRINDFFLELIEKYSTKRCFSIKIFGRNWWIHTNDVEIITHLLKNIDSYGKGPTFKEHFGAFLGEGVFSSDGELWYKHRKTSSHLFNLNVFKNGVLDTFNHHGEEMIAKIAKYEGKPFDIQDVFFRFTLDSIGQIAFGTSFHSQQQERVPFAEAFDYLQYEVNLSFLDPLFRLKRMFSTKYTKSLKLVNDIALSVVKQRKKEFIEAKQEGLSSNVVSNGMKGGKYDIISLYLQRHDEEKDGELPDNVLRDVVINFMIAGRDTTANALSWSIYRLCIHPEIQCKVTEEIMTTLKKFQLKVPDSSIIDHNFRISYECLQEMKYLDAFSMEVLRLHPSVPREAKFVLKKDTLPDGTIVTPGMMISYHPYTMGRTKELWGKDCLEFKPERFIGVPKPSPFIFSAFQAGPRICLGQNLALLEMKYALVRLLASFQFKIEQDPMTVTYVPTIALPIKDRLLVSVTKR